MTDSAISAIALDAGTTSIKAGLIDQQGELKQIIVKPAPKIAVSGGRYESDALAYAEAADLAMFEVLEQSDGCSTFGFCSQRSTFLVWKKSNGQPLTPLISWQDNRGANSCDDLRTHEDLIRSLSGLPLTPYYFAPKLRSLLLENPDWLFLLARGDLLVGTLDTYLIWRWSGGRYHVTDASMAARTLLMDIRLQQWSPVLCHLFGIPLQILPQIMASSGMKLRLDNGLILDSSIGDQSAALFASVREDSAEALVNLGTGCFVVRYIPKSNLVALKGTTTGYLYSLVYLDGWRRPHYAIEGTLNSIAPALRPYPVDACRSENLAVDDIFCLAEPSGLGAPYFRNDLGIQFSAPIDHLSNQRVAVLLLEAIIFRVARILEEFNRQSTIERVYLSGGLSELQCLQDGIAQCSPFAFFRLRQSESSLQGAALLAAGKSQASFRDSEEISTAKCNKALLEKYKNWKDWLDSLLELS